MAIIAPFKGLTYNFHVRQNFSSVVAPPYDVISEKEQEEYYRADPHNVIRLILGKKKMGDSDWDNRYTRAADYLKRWESDDTLIAADQPCIYFTSLTYTPLNEAAQRTRWGIIVLVRIEDRNSKVILPHERTFSAHKDDRLKLMRATNTQLSQIFGLYEDSGDTISEACREAIDFPPATDFEKDDMHHKMWILKDSRLFKKVADVMSGKAIFIADGHHRYETARNFRNIMRGRYGQRPADKSYEYVMMSLSNMSGEGLTILPSHRLIKGVSNFSPERFFEKSREWFDVDEITFPGNNLSHECTLLRQKLEERGRENTVFAFYPQNASHCHIFSLKPGAREKMGKDLHSSLKKLDVLVLSRFIFQRCLGFSEQDLDNDKLIQYQSSMNTAVSQVRSGDYQMVFLLNPTRIEQVKEIATNELVMPRKSTYFYPKILTGLVFNKINPHESIQVP